MNASRVEIRRGRLYIQGSTDKTLVGCAAPDVLALAQTLQAQGQDLLVERFGTLETAWTRDRLMGFGHAICALIRKGDQPRPLRERHLRLLRAFGVGPSRKTLCQEFGTFTKFKSEIGSPHHTAHGRFEHWSLANYVAFAAKLAKRAGDKPTPADYTKAFLADECPSISVIARRMAGGLGKLHEYVGYPNVRNWDNDEFLLWGIQALRANPNQGISRTVIDALSRLKRGPSTRTIVNRFHSVGEFQAQVEAELERADKMATESVATKIGRYTHMAQKGRLDPRLLRDNAKLLRVGAQRQVVDCCLPHLTEQAKQRLAARPSNRFIYWVLRTNETAGEEYVNRSLTAGHIEATAVMLDVFDDIWPLGQFAIEHLCVPLPPKGRYHRYRPGLYRAKQEQRLAKRG